ncbi:hypothetical protein lerEdw1_015332 [Lerista edwardsae]|nr:hypothetical protein lerEdw1_015332 [Lerista edwardsae]
MESSPENGVIQNCMENQLHVPSAAAMVSDTGKTRRSVTQWTVPEVCAWLSNRPLGAQGGRLLETANSHAISGKVLLRLTDETLERMGIAPGSLRQELLHEVLCLRIQQEMEDLLDITGSEGCWSFLGSKGVTHCVGWSRSPHFFQ